MGKNHSVNQAKYKEKLNQLIAICNKSYVRKIQITIVFCFVLFFLLLVVLSNNKDTEIKQTEQTRKILFFFVKM